MALLYSKEDCMDETNGEGAAVKKIKAKKRRLDNGTGEKQIKVSVELHHIMPNVTPKLFKGSQK